MAYFRDCFAHLPGITRRRIPPTPADDLRLHRLERPEPWTELDQHIRNAIAAINFYPDYAPFYQRLSVFLGVPVERIVVGAGVEGLIRDLFMLCCDPQSWVAFPSPTCAMFDIYATVFGARAAHIVMDPAKPMSAEAFCAALNPDVRLVILPNPGQPVETVYGLSELAVIASRCRDIGAVLAIDEAYYGFGAPTALPLVDDFDNLVVLRSFSKAFGGAALRVGVAIGHRSIISYLDAVRASGEISGPSLAAATVLMDHWNSHVLPGIRKVSAGRDWLRNQVRDLGFNANGYVANHVLIDMGGAGLAEGVAERLLWNKVRVKAGFPAPVDRHLLVTCGTRPLMERFLEEFQLAL